MLVYTDTTTTRYVDVSGNVRIWDTINAENVLKTETRVFSGRVNDLCWDHESKRIIAVGEGKDKYVYSPR